MKIGQYPAGFRVGGSTVDQLFTMKQMLEFNLVIHQIFIDFKQTYESIDQNIWYKVTLDHFWK